MKSLVLPAVFPSSSIFFDADITILQGWATYASVHSWLTHSLCSGLFSDWMVFCLLQSQFKPGMSRFGFAILH
nr:MAG TPA: hypothetical protein [Caudoviricetes sp.]